MDSFISMVSCDDVEVLQTRSEPTELILFVVVVVVGVVCVAARCFYGVSEQAEDHHGDAPKTKLSPLVTDNHGAAKPSIWLSTPNSL